VTDPAALTYASYLALDEVLGAQRPRSDEHDELLFIVIHQVYELWFKQLLHELRHLRSLFQDAQSSRSLHTLRRILTILKVAVAQIDVLETMTPRQFTSFRDRLDAASGFQSAQFRELEALLGRRDPDTPPANDAVRAVTEEPSVFDAFVSCLAEHGYDVPPSSLDHDVTVPRLASDGLQRTLFDVYADDGVDAQVCERLVDLDEGLQEWRYRHVKMVERTIGDKAGTGGSSGAAYLRSTLFRPLFPDLWAVRARL